MTDRSAFHTSPVWGWHMCKYNCAGQEGLVAYMFKTAHVLVSCSLMYGCIIQTIIEYILEVIHMKHKNISRGLSHAL